MFFQNHKKLFLFLTGLIILVGSLFFVNLVGAQSADTYGLDTIGQNVALGGQDIRITIAKIINVVLGLLGVIALSILLYAGYLYMTAGGNEEQITQARNWIKNAIIGLAIILSAFIIVSFIINKLSEATGVEESDTGVVPQKCLMDETILATDPDCDFCRVDAEACCAENHFIIKSITPSTANTQMNNVVVRALFSRPVNIKYQDVAELKKTVKIFQGDTDLTDKFDFVLAGDNRIIELRPNSQINYQCVDGSNCLPFGAFKIQVQPSVSDDKGNNLETGQLSCGSFSAEADFIVGEVKNTSTIDNSALYFDGKNNYVEIPVNQGAKNLDIDKGDFTLLAWANPEQFVDKGGIVGKGGWVSVGQSGYHLAFGSNPQVVEALINDGQKYANSNFAWLKFADSSTVFNNKWNHFVLMRKDGLMSIYLNGGLIDSINGVTGSLLAPSQPFLIGKDAMGRDYYFKGLIDNVSLYQRALTAEEIKADWQGQDVNKTALAGRWNFDEIGDTALDSSGNGNNGLVKGKVVRVNRNTGLPLDGEFSIPNKDIVAPIIQPLTINGVNSFEHRLNVNDKVYNVSTTISDNSGFAYVHLKVEKLDINNNAEGQPISQATYYNGPSVARGSDAPPANPFISSMPLRLLRNVYKGGKYLLTVEAHDIDDKASFATTILNLVPKSCHNNQWDPGEDEGSVDTGEICGGGEGSGCKADNDCAYSYKCIDEASSIDKFEGYCRAYPIIETISPYLNGAVGNYVTVVGKHFGETSGVIGFASGTEWVTAFMPNCGQDVWHDNWAVVAVPSLNIGNVGPIKLIRNSEYDLEVKGIVTTTYDISDDNWGPGSGLPGVFTINNTKRPGLCSVGVMEDVLDNEGKVVIPAGTNAGLVASKVSAVGTGFGTSQGSNKIWLGGQNSKVNVWSPTTIQFEVPGVATNIWQAVYAEVGNEKSNGLPFRVLDKTGLNGPIINEISPASTTPGSYVTIYGSRFGDQPGQIFMANSPQQARDCSKNFDETKCAELSDQGFPDICKGQTWFKDHVTVRVPEDLPIDLTPGERIVVKEKKYDLLDLAGIQKQNLIDTSEEIKTINSDGDYSLMANSSLYLDLVLKNASVSTSIGYLNVHREVLQKRAEGNENGENEYRIKILDVVDRNTGVMKNRDFYFYYWMNNPEKGGINESFPLEKSDDLRVKFKVELTVDKMLNLYLAQGEAALPNLPTKSFNLNDKIISSTPYPLQIGGINNDFADAGFGALELKKYIAEKIGSGYLNLYVLLKTANGLISSGNNQEEVKLGPPQPGICLLDPQSGPAPLPTGENLKIYGSNLSTTTEEEIYFDTEKVDNQFKLENKATTNGWLMATATAYPLADQGQGISTFIPFQEDEFGKFYSLRKNGPIFVKSNGEFSNSLPYEVIDCNLASDAEKLNMKNSNYQCCTAGGADKGKWKPSVFVCEGDKREAGYVWRFYTGKIPQTPRVMEECNEADWNNPGAVITFPSPVPSTKWKSGKNACVNSTVAVRFNMDMDEATLNSGTVKLYTCGVGDVSNCTGDNKIVVPISDSNLFYEAKVLKIKVPPPNLDSGTWYHVELLKGIKSLEITQERGERKEFSEPLEITRSCGGQTAYCYDFKTGLDKCVLKSVSINPFEKNYNLLGYLQDARYPFVYDFASIFNKNYLHLFNYYLNGLGDQACSVLEVDGLGWQWQTDNSAVATVELNPGLNKNKNYTDSRAIAKASAVGTTKITATFVTSTGDLTSTFIATSTLTVGLDNPQVINWWPNCAEACANGTIGVNFNMTMMTSTYPEGLKVFKCVDEFCDDYDHSPIGLNPYQSTGNELSFVPAVNLAEDTWYKVIVASTIKAVGGINTNGSEIEGKTSKPFSWRFRTKEQGAFCVPAKAVLQPDPFVAEMIGQQKLYNAVPLSSPDICSAFGQPLNPWKVGWTWSIANNDVAVTTNFSVKGALKPYCGTNCLPLGSNISYAESTSTLALYICGNGVVDPGEDCDVAGDISLGVAEIAGQSCTLNCLRPGNKNATTSLSYTDIGKCGDGFVSSTFGEECDWGKSEQKNYCTKVCTWQGSAKTQPEGSAKAAWCGSGDKTLGEDCDLTLVTTTNAGKIGCSESCLHLGTKLSRAWCDDLKNINLSTSTPCKQALSVCGNDKIEKGEECDRNIDNVGTCSDTCLLKDVCDDFALRQCKGTEGCNTDCTLAGSSLLYGVPSLCGDGVNGIGEFNDCELAVSDYGTRSLLYNNPVQLVSAVGLGAVGDYFDAQLAKQLIKVQRTNIKAIATQYLDEKGVVKSLIPNITGSSTYYLQCGNTEYDVAKAGKYNDCANDGSWKNGVATNSCCLARPERVAEYPADGAGIADNNFVCPNTYLEVKFNKKIDEQTLFKEWAIATGATSTNIIIARGTDSDCKIGEVDVSSTMRGLGLDLAMVDSNQSTGFWQKVWQGIKHFFGKIFGLNVFATTHPVTHSHWCVGGVSGVPKVGVQELDNQATTTVSIYLTGLLTTSSNYAVFLHGGPSGIKDIDGVGIGNPDARLRDDVWLFRTASKVCKIAQVAVSPTSYLFDAPNTTTTFRLQALTDGGQQIVSMPGIYSWDWVWGPPQNRVFAIPYYGYDADQDQVVVGSNAVEGYLTAYGQTIIKEDKDTIGGTPIGKTFSAPFDLSAYFCENIWPPKNGDGSWSEFKDPIYNFSFHYCADAGVSGNKADDLPYLAKEEITDPAKIGNLSVCAGTGTSCLTNDDCDDGVACVGVEEKIKALKKYLFFSDKNDDAIGLQIIRNPERKTASKWFVDEFVNAQTPKAITLAGYDGVQDGDNYYLNALNVNTTTKNVYNNIYQFSLSKGAGADTKNVLIQILDSLKFNTNLFDYGKCGSVSGNVDNFLNIDCYGDLDCAGKQKTEIIREESLGTCVNEDGGYTRLSNISCRRHEDCINSGQFADNDPQYPFNYCSSYLSGEEKIHIAPICLVDKTKLARDYQRVKDIKGVQDKIATYYSEKNKYPDLKKVSTFEPNLSQENLFASYLPGYVVSRWPSWGGFGQLVLKGAVPVDPINYWECPDGYDQQTCWNATTLSYFCSATSSVYEYSYVSSTGQYQLHIPFEYLHLNDHVDDRGSAGDILGNVLNTEFLTEDRDCEEGLAKSLLGKSCGDGLINIDGEECDPPGSQITSATTTATGQGLVTKTCNQNCRWQIGTAVSLYTCGNGIVEPDEKCDDGVLNGKYGQCAGPLDVDEDGNSLACQALHPNFCGNGDIDTDAKGKALEFCEKVSQVQVSQTINLGTCGHDNGRYCVKDEDCYGALSFSADSSFVKYEGNLLNNLFNNSFTLTIWFKKIGERENQGGPIVALKDDTSNDSIILALVDGKIEFRVPGDRTQYNSVVIGNDVSNQWNHLALIYEKLHDIKKMYFYVNGVKKQEVEGSFLPEMNNVNKLFIGGTADVSILGVRKNLIGFLDEPKIFKTALTVDEVIGDYGGGAGVFGNTARQDNLILGWHFDEKSGSFAYNYKQQQPGGRVFSQVNFSSFANAVNGAEWIDSGVVKDICENVSPKYTRLLYGDNWQAVDNIAEICGNDFLCRYWNKMINHGVLYDRTHDLNLTKGHCASDSKLLCATANDCQTADDGHVFLASNFDPLHPNAWLSDFSDTAISQGNCITDKKFGSAYNFFKEATCSWDCQKYGQYCGDKIITSPEQCDDGNSVDNDACHNDCTTNSQPVGKPVCGNKMLEGAEQCDDGNFKDGDGCSSVCKNEPTSCGDDNVQKDGNSNGVKEACDEGLAKNGTACVTGYGQQCVYCSADCRKIITVDPTMYCGNGKIEEQEVCDTKDGIVYAPYDTAIKLNPMDTIKDPERALSCSKKQPKNIGDYFGNFSCTNNCTAILDTCVTCGKISSGAVATARFLNVLSPYASDESGRVFAWPLGSNQLGLNIFYFDVQTATTTLTNPTTAVIFGAKSSPINLLQNIGTNALCKDRYSLAFSFAGEEGSHFDYPVNGEGNMVENEYVISPPTPTNTFRVVVRWTAKEANKGARFQGVVYNTGFSSANGEPGQVSYVNALATGTIFGDLLDPAKNRVCNEINYEKDCVGKHYNGVYAHNTGDLDKKIYVQSFTIDTDKRGIQTKNYAFVVDEYALVKPIGEGYSSPITPFIDGNVQVEVYAPHPNKMSIYKPDYVFSLNSNEVNKVNGVYNPPIASAEYWHPFDLVYDNASGAYKVQANNDIEADWQSVQESYNSLPATNGNILGYSVLNSQGTIGLPFVFNQQLTNKDIVFISNYASGLDQKTFTIPIPPATTSEVADNSLNFKVEKNDVFFNDRTDDSYILNIDYNTGDYKSATDTYEYFNASAVEMTQTKVINNGSDCLSGAYEDNKCFKDLAFVRLKEENVPYRYIINFKDIKNQGQGFETFKISPFNSYFIKQGIETAIGFNNGTDNIIFKLSQLGPGRVLGPVTNLVDLNEVTNKNIWYVLNVFKKSGNIYLNFVNQFLPNMDAKALKQFDN